MMRLPQGLTAGRLALALVFGAAVAAFFALDGPHYLSLEALREHRAALLAWHEAAPLRSAAIFVLCYAGAVALSLPGAIWLTIAGGFLFGPVAGVLCSVAGATSGAVLVFLAARYVFADLCRAKAGSAIARLEAGFRRNALSYLLFLRLMPVVPFWLINLVAAALDVRLATFFIATLFGIVPTTIVYVLIGNGLGTLLDQGGEPDLGILLKPEVLAPLAGLALLALLPVVYHGWRGRAAAARRRPHP